MSNRLLVIDDALIIREMIKDASIDAGWEIAGEAGNGKQGVEAYLRTQPDAVTLDLVMPEYDGLRALRDIIAADSAARVLIVSALNHTEILKEAIQSGAADFIVKPFEPHQLVSALNKMIGLSDSPPLSQLHDQTDGRERTR